MQNNDENRELDQLLIYVQESTAPQPVAPQPTMKREIFELAKMVVWLVVLFYGLRTFVVEGFEIRGHSMEQTLENNERVLVLKFVYTFRDIKQGDVIVFKFPDDPKRRFVKRVIGVPGDTVAMVDGDVFVNGMRIDEPYVHISSLSRTGASQNLKPTKVPKGEYYVLGDHRNVSSDSRSSMGAIPRHFIVGKAVLRFWPPTDMGLL
jgi:signal peptidase I